VREGAVPISLVKFSSFLRHVCMEQLNNGMWLVTSNDVEDARVCLIEGGLNGIVGITMVGCIVKQSQGPADNTSLCQGEV
jgi:hypothetical protein